jgi:hypothetical protein
VKESIKYVDETGTNPHQLLKLALTVKEIDCFEFAQGIGMALTQMYTQNIELPALKKDIPLNLSKGQPS